MAESSEEKSLHLSEINPSLASGMSSKESSASAPPSEGTSLRTECNPSSNMSSSDGTCSNDEKEKVERIEIVIESMREMFVTFFKPNDIVKVVFDAEENQASKLLRDSLCHPDRRMHAFLEELINSETPLMKFYKHITTLDPETNCLPLALLSGAGEKLHEKISRSIQLIEEIVEKSNVNSLNSIDMKRIVDDLSEADFMKIPPRKSKQFSSFLSLLQSNWFSRSKPDWPFYLWEVLLKIRPDLFVSNHSRLQASTNEGIENQIDSLKENFPNGAATPDIGTQNDSYMGLKKRSSIKRDEVKKESLSLLVDQGALKWEQVSQEESSENTARKTLPEWSVQNNFSDDDDDDDNDDEDDSKDEETHPKVAVEDDGNPTNKADLNLRSYQNELARNALDGENTIILAPTGSGKTRVALDIIIKHLRGNQGQTPSRKVCFFARTVPLADQQYKTICKFLPPEYKAQLFTGDSEYSAYLHMLLPELDVIVLTPMILQNHLRSKNIKDLCVFSLLVFDECHHTREKEPYNILMSSYVDQKLAGNTKLPQVVGLTASFPVEKAKTEYAAAESIRQLCANMDTSVISCVLDPDNIRELEEKVAVPIEDQLRLEELDEDKTFTLITDVMELLERDAKHCAEEIKEPEILKKLESIPENKKKQMYDNWAVELLQLAGQVPRSESETLLPVRLLIIIAWYLIGYHSALEAHDLVHITDVLEYLENYFAGIVSSEAGMRSDEERFYNYFQDLKLQMEQFYHHSNPNLLILKGVIEDFLIKKGPDSRGIIFVRTRAVAEALKSWLNRCGQDDIEQLNASIFTGTNAKESLGGMTQAQQSALVKRFKEGKVRLLVATSVAEEGLDVPSCNIVIKYNHVGNEITTIQTRGRSRKKGGHSVLLAMQDICIKEMINRQRTVLMKKGVDLLIKTPREEFISSVLDLQKRNSEDREIEELAASKLKEQYKDKTFKMFCKLCRQFCVESKDLRIMCQNFRIVVNRDVWNIVRVYPKKDPKYIDETKIVGSVRCRELVDGAECDGALGTLVLYQGVVFLAVGIKNFNFEEEGSSKLISKKKWKQVPYPVKDLSSGDIKSFIAGPPNEQDASGASNEDDSGGKLPKEYSGVQETEPPGGSQLSLADSNSDFSLEPEGATSSYSSRDTDEIIRGYPEPLDSTLSSFCSRDSHHETEKKELV